MTSVPSRYGAPARGRAPTPAPIPPPILVPSAPRARRPADVARDRDRSVRRRIGITWALLVLNVLTFYPKTWSGQPLIIPIPSVIGKAITQGALPAALIMAFVVNRRRLVRPSVFLGRISLLVIEALITCIQARYFGTVYRSFRLAAFVATLWLLSPWWGRRDLLLVRCHVIATSVVLGAVLLGLIVSPSQALGGGRLGGAFWPTPPPQVAEFAAVTMGLVVVMWLAGQIAGRATLAVIGVAITILLLSHTRTALIAMVLGIFVAGLSLVGAEPRARRLFASVGVVVTLVAVMLSEVVTTWLERGEGSRSSDQPHRPDQYLGGGGQHPAEHVPADLWVRLVEQLG